MIGPSVSASAGAGMKRLVLPDRPVLLDLLVDLLDERVGDRRRELRVVELADDEVEPHLRLLFVDRGRRRDVDRVDDAAEPDLREPGPVVVDVDATVRDTARRHERLLRQHHRARTVGVVRLQLGDLVGAVHELEVRGVGTVLRHLLRHGVDDVRRRVEVRPAGVADLLDVGDLPLRRFVVRVVPRRARTRCARSSGTSAASPSCCRAGCRGCSCTRRCRRTSSRGTGRPPRCPTRSRRRRCGHRDAGSTRPAGGTPPPRRATGRGRGPSSAARSPRRARGPRGTRPGTSRRGSGTGNGEP